MADQTSFVHIHDSCISPCKWYYELRRKIPKGTIKKKFKIILK